MGNGGSSPSARWAADPSGRHAFRYWDGSRWTGHVADGAFAPNRAPEGTEPPGGAPAETEPAEHAPPDHEASDVAPEDEGNTETATEVPAETAEEHPESRRRERRQAARRRKAFRLGALTGAGIVLIGVAIAAVALNVKINPSSSTAKRRTVRSTTTTTTIPPTTTTVNPGRPPNQVRVEIVNASGVLNAAGAKAIALVQQGYVSAGLADAPVRQGTAVQCRPGYEAEAVTLSKAVGPGTTVEPFPNPPPAGSTSANCVVVLGK